MKLRIPLFWFCLAAFLLGYPTEGIPQDQKEKSVATIDGYVYEDINKNGKKDEGEKGIPNVLISNQQKVVATSKDGYYKLPVKGNTVISVSKPAGYKLKKNENNLPQFYYIHQPDGSPNLRFSGVEPSGPLPDSLNFGLIPSQKKESFKAIIFGDPQPRNHRELSYYRDDIVSEIANIDADLTLVLGDIMFDDLSLYDRYNSIMKAVGTPVFNLFGNHDINFTSDGNIHARETFKKHYGPTYFSFEYGDVYFIALNNIDYLGIKNSSGPYRGYLGDEQLEWVKNTVQHIEPDKLIVLMSHIPLYSDNGKGKKKNTVNRQELLQLLKDRDRLLYLSAHRHRIFHDFLDDEVNNIVSNPLHHIALAAASGAWWDGPKKHSGIPTAYQRDGVPNGYHIFEFDGNKYRERYKGAGHEIDFQMRIERPQSSLSREEFQDSELLVNVFNGNEKSEVKYRLNGKSEWSEMQRLENHHSPFFEEHMEGYRNPGHTNHIWKANLPELGKGIHKIKVHTTDMYGREFTQTKIIEIN